MLPPPRTSGPHRHLALGITIASFAVWAVWYLLLGPKGPYGDLSDGTYTDHFSHMNTARLFVSAGTDIWAAPLRYSVRVLTPTEQAALPADLTSQAGQDYPVFTVNGWPADKPFVASWWLYPDFHPPGDIVLTAPIGALSSVTGLSFSGANRLLILEFLALAHISLFVLFKSGIGIDRLRPVGFLVLALVYLEFIHWSLEGFYEPLLLAPLVLSARFLAQGKGLQGLAMFALAADLHFRAYFFGPLAVYGAYLVLRNREWRTWKATQYLLAAATVVMSAISLGVFALVWPWLREVEANNPVGIVAATVNLPAVATLLVIAVVAAAVFVYSRAWLDLALVAWIAVATMLLQQVWPWDVLTIIAWLAFPIGLAAANKLELVRDTRIAAVLGIGTFVFGNATLLDPSWLLKVF
jgi:hypothetical protein